MAAHYVGNNRAQNAPHIHPVMLEEATIFGGDNRLHQLLRKFVIGQIRAVHIAIVSDDVAIFRFNRNALLFLDGLKRVNIWQAARCHHG